MSVGRRSYDDATVEYTVKELLERIEKQQLVSFTELVTKLDTKADKSDLDRMERRLDNHASRLHDLESELEKSAEHQAVHTSITEQTWSRRHKLMAAGASFLLILATFFGPYAANHI